ncbi:MAG TPA: hypothetical protein VF665_20815 [Longimicrobium sp.]|jgi:hypothetical protein|uniref:hypothetical protein n=1 Tax=Longimicrobium sp. TaxID=2029185 RepID=UPI002ED8EE5E
MIEHTTLGRAIRLLLVCGGLAMAAALGLGVVLLPAAAFAVPHSVLWTPSLFALHITTLTLRTGLALAALGVAACVLVMAIPARTLSRLPPDQPLPGTPS